VNLIRQLRRRLGPLLFHLSSGCCEGTAPLCLRQDEFHLGSHDVLLGEIDGAPVYTSESQATLLTNAELLIDVMESESDSFSVEAGEGVRFTLITLTPKSSCVRK
jgi:uncharacterized protein (DUF779 family)